MMIHRCRFAGARARLACFALITAASVAGCQQSEVELGAVEGKVTMDQQPLPDATIRFIPVAGGRSALGRTDTEGHYEMLYTATADGALVGSMRVEITTGDPDNPKEFPETVPAKYNLYSELKADVKSGSNELNFELTSK
jgi:hypothetical protein